MTWLPREKYLDPPRPGVALWLRVCYPGAGLAREEIFTTSAESDAYGEWARRVSPDNGRTWSALEPLPEYHQVLPGGSIAWYPQGVHYDGARDLHYRAYLTYTWRGLPLFTYDWQTGNHPCSPHVLVEENGRRRQLRFEDGPEYATGDPFDPELYETNRAYMGQSFAAAADGTLWFPVVCAPRGRRFHSRSGVRLMRRDAVTAEWTASNLVDIGRDRSSVAFEEPDVALLKDGRLLVICRGAATQTTPPRKWVLWSVDGGRTLSEPQPLCYEDSEPVISPNSIHYFFRSTRNGRLYWVANILDHVPTGHEPRYPLSIAEINETTGTVRRETLVAVDDRRPGEPEVLQLSNFALLEDRETQDLEIYVTRLGEDPARFWHGAVYRYRFSPPA